MTDEQRNTILRMRKDNNSYASISKSTGLAISTIKMYCCRNSIYPGFIECKECGMPIPKRNKKFCSSKCRNTWWKKHKKEVYKNRYSFKCEYCNKVFVRSRNDHLKYCSHSCYIADRYKEVKNGY